MESKIQEPCGFHRWNVLIIHVELATFLIIVDLGFGCFEETYTKGIFLGHFFCHLPQGEVDGFKNRLISRKGELF